MSQRRGKRTRISDRGHQGESAISNQHLGNFTAVGSRGQRFIQSLCGDHNITKDSLINLAHVFSCISGVRFPRDFARRRVLVIKWFNDNLDEFESIGGVIHLEIVRA
jgi:hypothetical protein